MRWLTINLYVLIISNSFIRLGSYSFILGKISLKIIFELKFF